MQKTRLNERILDALLPTPAIKNLFPSQEQEDKNEPEATNRQLLREKLLAGELDDKTIELELASQLVGVEIMAPPGMEEMTSQSKHVSIACW